MATSGRISEAFLDDFANAWNRHDVDAILSMMTADCVFESSRSARTWLGCVTSGRPKFDGASRMP